MDSTVCARCADRGTACCTIAPGEEAVCFPLSPWEIERIAPHAPDIAWHVAEPNSLELHAMLQRLFPMEAAGLIEAFPLGRDHERLATDARGRCVLLDSFGCLLPVEARPLHCSLFPFWMKGREIMILDADCLAIGEARGPAMLFRSLAMDPDRVRSLFASLRVSLGLAA
ncbi:MAG: zinc/iron-chelating domain-containing protein [Desulfovibrio sp.]|nr:MAG: zinc/iron-chelating domain-containing protein [Desulfovibrio sp.]